MTCAVRVSGRTPGPQCPTSSTHVFARVTRPRRTAGGSRQSRPRPLTLPHTSKTLTGPIVRAICALALALPNVWPRDDPSEVTL
jgi:hypothetical protein